jgi:ABC-2 type transport system permease protein
MSKILTITKREFLSRVQKKTFLLTTILLPVIIFAIYGGIIFFSIKSEDNFRIAITDKANVFGGKIESKNDDIIFSFLPNENEANLRDKLKKKEFEGYVWVSDSFNASKGDTINYVSGKTIGLLTREKIQRRLNNALEQHNLLTSLNITKTVLDSLQRGNEIKFATIEGKEENDLKAGISYGVGYVAGFVIYFVLFLYGSMVMRGVMEEKTNRIAEVIISSVKPFQLMMGKILGIGAVGLVQFLIWIALTIFLRFLLPMVIPGMQETTDAMNGGTAQALAEAKQSGAMSSFFASLQEINITAIVVCFLFYFIGGYFLYASLFAAVGSAVNEDPQDAQSLLFPIMMPIIIAIIIMTKAVNDPTSGLAVFGSLFPLTSPIVMMARLPFGIGTTVPYWQLFASIALLIGGFIGTTWLSGKIYRTGILMYGKKVTWKELWKWAVVKN